MHTTLADVEEQKCTVEATCRKGLYDEELFLGHGAWMTSIGLTIIQNASSNYAMVVAKELSRHDSTCRDDCQQSRIHVKTQT